MEWKSLRYLPFLILTYLESSISLKGDYHERECYLEAVPYQVRSRPSVLTNKKR